MARNPSLWVLYLTAAAHTTMMGMALPLIPQFMKEEFQAAPLLVGIVTGTYGLLQIVGRLPMGNLSDHYGRRNSLAVAFAASFLGGLFFVFAPGPWWLLPGEALFGLASGIFWVSANSYIAEAVPPADLSRAMSRYAIAIDAGFLVGPLLSGVADFIGFRQALTVFLWGGILGLFLVYHLPSRGYRGALRPARELYGRAWELLHIPDILISAAGTFTYALLFGAISAFLPYYLRNLGYTAIVVGVIFSLRSVVSIGTRPPLPRLMDRWGPRGVLYAGAATAALSVGLVPFFDTAVPIAVLAAGMGLGIGFAIPANLTLVGHAAPEDSRGLANGIYGTALGLGTTVSPLAFGAAADAFGIQWAFWGPAIMSLLLAASLPFVYGALARRADAPAAEPGSAT